MATFPGSAGTTLTAQARALGGIVNQETLAAGKTLDGASANIQILDPDGSSRTITLAKAAYGTAIWLLYNAANAAGELLNVVDAAAVAITSLDAGEGAFIAYDGTTWRSVPLNVTDAGDKTIQADVIQESTAGLGVTIDSLPIKDGGLTIIDSGSLKFGTPGTDLVVTADGTDAVVTATGDLVLVDSVDLKIGTSKDLGLVHDGTNSLITNTTGNLVIDSQAATGALLLDLGTDTSATQMAVRNNSGSTLLSVLGSGVVSIGAGQLLSDYFVRATIAVANATGGATDAALTVDLFRQDGTTVLGGAKQILIVTSSVQYSPVNHDTSVTFGTATKGSIIASGGGWCLAETDADGEFDCTATNATDETVYFSIQPTPTGGQSDLSKACYVISNSDAATWSA